MPDAAHGSPVHVLIAGVSARAMAESAARAGYRVTALDAFGDLDQHPGVRALSLARDFGTTFTARAAALASRAVDCDAVAYLSSFENHRRAVSTLAEGRSLWGNPPSALRRARDPKLLAAALERSALVAGDRRSANPRRWVIKPRASGGGHGIRWWSPGEPVPRGSHVQGFVDGTPGSVVFVAANGRAVPLGISRQLIGERAFGAGGFRYCGSILAAAGDAQFADDAMLALAACDLAATMAEKFDLVGVNGVDFAAANGVPHAVEVNPRYSASMELVERAYDVSIFGAHAVACSTGDLPRFDLAAARAGGGAIGKAIVFAKRDVVCGDTRRWLDDPSVRDVPHPGERIEAGRPVCTVFVSGSDSVSCHAALVQRAERVYDELDRWTSIAA